MKEREKKKLEGKNKEEQALLWQTGLSKDIGKLKKWVSLLGSEEVKALLPTALQNEYARLFELHVQAMTKIRAAVANVLGNVERTDTSVDVINDAEAKTCAAQKDMKTVPPLWIGYGYNASI